MLKCIFNHNFAFTLIFVFFLFPMSGYAQMAVDPCPIPEQIAKNNPPDLAVIQAEIDILGLCVQRAKLLEELNNLVDEMYQESQSAAQITANRAMPSVSDLALKNDIPALSPDVLRELKALPTVENGPRRTKEDWEIVDIFGSVEQGVKARLRGKDGGVAVVKKGDDLATGHKVIELNLQGVSIEKEGTVKELNWKQL